MPSSHVPTSVFFVLTSLEVQRDYNQTKTVAVKHLHCCQVAIADPHESVVVTAAYTPAVDNDLGLCQLEGIAADGGASYIGLAAIIEGL